MATARATRLFHEALEKDPAERESFLLKAAPSEPTLRKEILELIAVHESSDKKLLEGSALDKGPPLSSREEEIPTFASGDLLGDFVIHRQLGEGAFARVYLATERKLGRRVALKVSADEGNEARTMAPLEHPSIVRVFSEHVFDRPRVRVICMQYVEAPTLRKYLQTLEQAGSKMPLERVVRTGIQLADALTVAHSRGVLHLDIKPENIFIGDELALLVDFNVSRGNAGENHQGGTFRYMPPEQELAFMGRGNVDERSDLFALGRVLEEMARLSNGSSPELDKLIARCCDAQPSVRPASARLLAIELEKCLRALLLANSIPASNVAALCSRHPRTWLMFASLLPLLAVVAVAVHLFVSPRLPVPFAERGKLFYMVWLLLPAWAISQFLILRLGHSADRWARFPVRLGVLYAFFGIGGLIFVRALQISGRYVGRDAYAPIAVLSTVAVAVGINGAIRLAEYLCWRVAYLRHEQDPQIATRELRKVGIASRVLHGVLIFLPLTIGLIAMFPKRGSNPSNLVGPLTLLFAGISGLMSLGSSRMLTLVRSAYDSLPFRRS